MRRIKQIDELNDDKLDEFYCKYFNTVKKFRANSVFRASASCSKILKDKEYFNTVNNSEQTLFFRASASCSKS